MLENLLSEARMSKAELARRLGVHRNTVYLWLDDKKLPQYVVAYLNLLIGVRKLGE